MIARLLLEDGTLFTGRSFGAEGERTGEVVFHTGMIGYQELLTDPSYYGQIVTMTYPQIGNYGVSFDEFESFGPSLYGLIVRDHEPVPSNWRARYTLEEYLKENGIVGISGIDTRMLTRHLRSNGTMKGIITTSDKPLEQLRAELYAVPPVRDQVARVSTKHIYRCPGSRERIVLVDFGVKNSIIRELAQLSCDIVVVPHTTTEDEIRKLHPDGIVLSNGPGDPKDAPESIATIQNLLGKWPLMGIGLGHQLLALASGADTKKLKFGHRGGNHPVKELATGRCFITSQNHGYTVAEESLAGTNLEVTHIHNNDHTIEGLRHTKVPAFSVQFQPETIPGQGNGLFEEFLTMVRHWLASRQTIPQQAVMTERMRKQTIGAKASANGQEPKGDLHYAQK